MIRPAHVGDRPRLLLLALRFIAETGYRRFVGSNPGQVGRYIDWVLQVGAFFVLEHEGEVVGFIAGAMVKEHPVSGECVVAEAAWFVEPEHRRGTGGVRLLDRFEQWARELEADRIEMVAPEGSPVGEFYVRRGYEPVETTFQKHVA